MIPSSAYLEGLVGRAGLALVLMVTAASFLFAEPVSAADPHWSIEPSPNLKGVVDNSLRAMSCVSESFCVAVGSFADAGQDSTLIQSWNGTAWRVVASPRHTPETVSSSLSGVSCVSIAFCVAVGRYSNGIRQQTLTETWNGSLWKTVPSPSPGVGDDYLQGVSCLSIAMCTAVGFYSPAPPHSGTQTLIESWDGTRWSVVPSPNPPDRGNGASFQGVSCVSALVCFAVGDFSDGGPWRTLVESWDGSAWNIVPSPNQGTNSNLLLGVACPSVGFCVAVGVFSTDTGTQTLIEDWDGVSWSIVPSPSPGSKYNNLNGVSCVSPTLCVAGGRSSDGVTNQTLVESWDGTAWSAVQSPNPGSRYNNLNGVSCVSSAFCVAAGEYSNGVITQTLIESSVGTNWFLVASPNAMGAVPNSLSGVSCVSAKACVAAGSYGDKVSRALIESWDGNSWRTASIPNPGSDARLPAISCVSFSTCTAVGSYTDGGVLKTLIESSKGSTNGAVWSVVPSPNPGDSSQLNGVSCLSNNFCVAVGSYASNGVGLTLIESWDGTAWSVVPSPNPGDIDNQLLGVSCLSATSCTAVGSYFQRDVGGLTLIESWDGTTWSVVPSPNPPDNRYGAFLEGVSCVSATFCTAVGWDSVSLGLTNSFVESWDGTSWSLVPSPNPGTSNDYLNGVSCLSPSACMAVGSLSNDVDITTLTFTELWDGTSWSVVPSPSPGAPNNVLSAVSCLSPSLCTAVGSYSAYGGQTLIEVYR